MVAVLQAVDFLECTPRLSSYTLQVYKEIRKIFPKFIEDKPLYKELKQVKNYLEKAENVFSGKSSEKQPAATLTK
jgi:histidine ammonia-lyase